MPDKAADRVAEPLLLTAAQAARALGISPRFLWSMTNRSEVRCVRIGRSVRYSVDDLRAFIAAKRSGERQP